jgi:hypothetical protein
MMKQQRLCEYHWQQLLMGSGAPRWSCSLATNAVSQMLHDMTAAAGAGKTP